MIDIFGFGICLPGCYCASFSQAARFLLFIGLAPERNLWQLLVFCPTVGWLAFIRILR